MKAIVVRDVDSAFFTDTGFGVTVYPNKAEAEQAALERAAAEPRVKFRIFTATEKVYCVDPSITWSTPEVPDAWRTQSWKQGWYELWQVKGNEKYSMSSVLLVVHTPEHGPGVLKHIQFNLQGSPGNCTSTNYRPVRAFKVQTPRFEGQS